MFRQEGVASGYPIRQYEEAPYWKQRMKYMKKLSLNICMGEGLGSIGEDEDQDVDEVTGGKK